MTKVDVQPCRYSVIVELDPVNNKVGSIIMPDDTREREQFAATRATLLAVGGNAFEDWQGVIPKPGDRVLMKKYPGQFTGPKADEADRIRIAQDTEVLGVLA